MKRMITWLLAKVFPIHASSIMLKNGYNVYDEIDNVVLSLALRKIKRGKRP